MSSAESLLLLLASIFYALHALWTVGRWFRAGRPRAALAVGLVGGGVALHTAFLVARAARLGGLPIHTRLDSLALFLWVVVGVFLASQRPYRMGGLAPLFWPFFAAGTLLAWLGAGREPVAESLDDVWLVLHLVPIYIGYAAFAIAAGAGLGHLVQERLLRGKSRAALWRRLPSLETLERVGRAALSLGFPAFTVGLVAGAVWAEQASAPLGRAWYADPKVVGGVVVWLFYAAVLHVRLFARVRGRRAAALTVVGFVLTVGSFLAAHLYDAPQDGPPRPPSDVRRDRS
jgi:ABC-type transport system involved in cytochrome c biogenesis permease subunit